MKYHIFISYRRSDTARSAALLQEKLKMRFNTFLDQEGIGKGEHWPDTLQSTLKQVSVVLALIGDGWDIERLKNEEDWVLKEIDLAIKEKKHIIPILVEGAKMPPEDQLPGAIKELPHFQAASMGNYYADVEALIREIEMINLADKFGREARTLYERTGGRYQFEKVVSNKKHRVIYLARDVKLNRMVVIRLLRDVEDQIALRETILDTVAFAEDLPNCVQIFDADFDRIPHVVLNYMEGGSLRKVVEDNRNGLSHTRVARILQDIGQALVRSGKSHCNLKPSNVLLNREDIPYLNAMNRIKIVSREKLLKDLAALESTHGTKDPSYREDLVYLPPEVFDDEYKGLNEPGGFEKIDQYMLGLMGYHLLTGKLPTSFRDAKELQDNELDKARFRERLGKVKKCVDDQLAEVLYKMTNPNPKDRYDKLSDAIAEIGKTLTPSIDADIDLVKRSYLRCLNREVDGQTFLEAFYTELIRDEEIKAVFEKFDVLEEGKISRRQQNHLQGAIFGLIEYANEIRLVKDPGQISFLRHVAERHGRGDDREESMNYFVDVRPKYFRQFCRVLVDVACGGEGRAPFDHQCGKSEEERENIRVAWEKVLEPGIEYMIDQL